MGLEHAQDIPNGMIIVGHGIDVVEVDRIASMLEDHGQRFLDRVFTPREQAYAEQGQKRRGERYAVRFAAKEAALKAIGTGWRDGIAWTDIEVVSLPSGQPTLEVTGKAGEIAAVAGIDRWLISMSHIGPMGFASVLGGRLARID